jgi:hypothetical protein
VVWLEGRTLLRLLDSFFSTATAAAADPKTAAGSAASAAAGGSAAVDLSMVDAVAAACEVAVLLSSYLQSFLDTACPSKPQLPSQQQQQQPGVLGPSCCILLVENLVGPHGSVTYMNRVQQQACLNPGRRAATK